MAEGRQESSESTFGKGGFYVQMFSSDTSLLRWPMVDEVHLSAAAPLRSGGEVDAQPEERQDVHAADFAAGGGLETANRHNTLQQGLEGKVLSSRGGAAESLGQGCTTTECKQEIRVTSRNSRKCPAGGATKNPIGLDVPRRCEALRVGELSTDLRVTVCVLVVLQWTGCSVMFVGCRWHRQEG